MSSFQLPDAVVAFAESYLSSLDELAVLIALLDAPSRWWDARTVARETGLPRGAAARILDHFAARNLLDIRVTDEVRYQYGPAAPEVKAAASALADAYRRNPAPLMRIVGCRPDRSLRHFSDAFRIRRDDTG